MSLRPQPTKSGLGYERTRPHIELLQNCSLRLSPRPVMALELGTHPKPTQIADALVEERADLFASALDLFPVGTKLQQVFDDVASQLPIGC